MMSGHGNENLFSMGIEILGLERDSFCLKDHSA